MNFDHMYDSCSLCPRDCKVNRHQTAGYCGCTDTVQAARAALHHWEEPCISGNKGSGTVFFPAALCAAVSARTIPSARKISGRN